jgi:hypothetical protein
MFHDGFFGLNFMTTKTGVPYRYYPLKRKKPVRKAIRLLEKFPLAEDLYEAKRLDRIGEEGKPKPSPFPSQKIKK